MIDKKYFGNPIKSALVIGIGEGKHRVEWHTSLPDDGEYEVLYYYFPGKEYHSNKFADKESRSHEFVDNKKIFYPKYSKEKREEMKKSILHFGLQQNLVVMYIRSENEYVVETGHNRMYSIDELIEDFKDYQDKESDEYKLYLKNVDEYSKRGYPCKVAGIIEEEKTYEIEENEDLSNVADEVIDSEIRARITNDIRRSDDEITPADRAANIERLAKLYTRKNLGKKRSEKININEQNC